MASPQDLQHAWRRFEAAAQGAARRRIAGLFEAEPDRLQKLSLEAAGLYLDLSKQPWDRAALEAAMSLAGAAGVEARRDALFAGERINATEGRAALHPALRAAPGAAFAEMGRLISTEVEAERDRFLAFAEAVRSGAEGGRAKAPFSAVVHVGIGGSDLGPRLAWEALRPEEPAIDLRFAANVDGAEIEAALQGLDPARTLVVIVSKTFATQETMANARAARAWLAGALGEAAAGDHLAAVSTALPQTRAFGIRDGRVFGFWDWVGGRFSLWSAVGLSCAIGLGRDTFLDLLAGAAAMDAHFRSAPLVRNAPVLLALSHRLNAVLGRQARAVVPYARRLRLLPAYLQQLEMESNGKGVGLDGRSLGRAASTAVFGQEGTNAQHAFFQALHQGADVIPAEFIAVRRGEGPDEHQAMLLANCLAQAEALMIGAEGEDRAPERRFPGNRPSNTILMDSLSPHSLGALLALFEHKTFVEGVLHGVNSFDQFGVELGKSLAEPIRRELEGGPGAAHDPSTAELIRRLKA